MIERPPSAELRENQKDQDSLPPYDVLDAILLRHVDQEQSREEIVAAGFDAATVDKGAEAGAHRRMEAAPGRAGAEGEPARVRARAALSDHQQIFRLRDFCGSGLNSHSAVRSDSRFKGNGQRHSRPRSLHKPKPCFFGRRSGVGLNAATASPAGARCRAPISRRRTDSGRAASRIVRPVAAVQPRMAQVVLLEHAPGVVRPGLVAEPGIGSRRGRRWRRTGRPTAGRFSSRPLARPMADSQAPRRM